MSSPAIVEYAVLSLWKRVGPSLVRLTADFSQNSARLEFIVTNEISTGERDSYEDSATEYLSYFENDSDLDIRIIEIERGEDLPNQTLPVEIFHRDVTLFD